jgi:hypothetical protein
MQVKQVAIFGAVVTRGAIIATHLKKPTAPPDIPRTGINVTWRKLNVYQGSQVTKRA